MVISQRLHWPLIAIALFVAGCADSDAPGPDGHPRAAGADQLRDAARAYAESAQVRRAADYSEAVGEGLMAPMVERAKHDAVIAKAKAKGMAPPRPLAVGERCIGGSIVRIDLVNGIPAYTQVLSGFQPIMCGG